MNVPTNDVGNISFKSAIKNILTSWQFEVLYDR